MSVYINMYTYVHIEHKLCKQIRKQTNKKSKQIFPTVGLQRSCNTLNVGICFGNKDTNEFIPFVLVGCHFGYLSKA